MAPKILSPSQAVTLICDQATVAIGGGGAGHAVPDLILEAIGDRFKQHGTPCGLTIIHPCGIGDNRHRGLNYLAPEGLLKCDIGGFWGNSPKVTALALAEKIEGYNLPQGVLSHLMRACASNEVGVLTRTGLHTFVDPRLEGGKINRRTQADLVRLIQIEGEELLLYKALPIDVGIIRGTSADKEGNLSMENEVGTFAMLSIAQAAKRRGGKVIAQVREINETVHTPSCQVKVPGVFIDALVVNPEQEMTFLSRHEPALILRDAPYQEDDLTLEGVRRIVARRAANELSAGAFVNLGYGMADGVPIVANQEGVLSKLIFMIEQGALAGIPTVGLNFGAMYNPSAILDDGYQFDFFHGGGLDLAFLGFAQIDQTGNVNSSRFGSVVTGCGGFIDISQHAKKVVFCGSMAVKGKVDISSKGLDVIDPGKHKKFVRSVQQVTFSGPYALAKQQEVLYVTERAVFKLIDEGIELIEIAPGADLQRDILNVMEFRPKVMTPLKKMNARFLRIDLWVSESKWIGSQSQFEERNE